MIQRGNNRGRCFFSEADYRVYLSMLHECANESGCDIHAYVLMTNHVHLLVTPATTAPPGLLMQRLGQRYVQYVNRKQGRSGTLWQGRFRSCLVGDERYLLTCQRYIELNPVRAGIVGSPGLYQWSSFRSNALGHNDPLLTPHPTYLSLGSRQADRQEAYRALFEETLLTSEINHIRAASNGNYVFGDSRFADMAERKLQRAVRPSSPGRRQSTTTRKLSDKSCSDPAVAETFP